MVILSYANHAEPPKGTNPLGEFADQPGRFGPPMGTKTIHHLANAYGLRDHHR